MLARKLSHYYAENICAFIFSFSTEYYIHYYSMTYNRLAPWLIGVAMGAILLRQKQKKKTPAINTVRKVIVLYFNYYTLQFCLQLQNVTMWFLVVAVTVGSALLEYIIKNRDVRIERSLFLAFHRPFWSLCLCWIIFACTFGYGGNV